MIRIRQTKKYDDELEITREVEMDYFNINDLEVLWELLNPKPVISGEAESRFKITDVTIDVDDFMRP